MRVDYSELNYTFHRFNDLLRAIPGLRAEALEAAGMAVLAQLRGEISQRVHDADGSVSALQVMELGSRGGYAAIRPAARTRVNGKTWGGSPVTAGQLTGWLERGHGVRKPSGNARRYEPKLRYINDRTDAGYVPGRMFYSWTAMRADEIAAKAAEQAMDDWDEIFYRNKVIIPGVYDADEYV